ncbi:uncharacterized protein LOC100678240 isoform X4 [Nasonia vitripennis]|uniref:SANTA domain-containing protein n=1 Tax=Nasonia vitripennis TaxID=7425 RepID=A0A7M7QTJ6_NASVI|nr:uncharacterized protein LOC100678240 isoform X4 [Nasonia vitripennis]
MDSPGFADLKKEERYKRLERNLKLAFVKQMERMKSSDEKGYYYTSPTWPSLSSINPDGMDMSCANGSPSLQVSRVESEVLSSSNNLCKVLTMHPNGHVEQRLPMATSSVKKFPINDSERDRAIMPPPPTTLFHNVKNTSSIDSNQIAQSRQGSETKLEGQVHDFSVKPMAGASADQESNISQTDSHNSITPREFSRWRVLLNDQGQLIIKGTLECGKIARSKPVIQRFTSTKVLSIYKHIYVLCGNIVDDRNELPDYVRGKFHNGFPDDWENVYQIWRNYTAGGCQITFRWPTPITDSDDDLQSQITDFSYIKNKQIKFKNKEQLSKPVLDNGSSLGYHSKLQTSGNKNLEKSNEKDEIIKAFKNQVMNEKIDDSGHSSDVKDTSQCNHERAENLSEDAHSSGANSSNSNLKNISFLYEIIREDKVRIILSKLGDKNCPAQYLDKFIDLIDCLKYLLPYKFSISNSEIEKREQNLSPAKNQNLGCSRCSNTASFSEMQETIPENQSNNLKDNPYATSTEINKNLQNPEYSENALVKDSHVRHLVEANSANESSDSDDYMGFPHVSLSHLIKPKLQKFERYRDRKNRSNERKNFDKNMQVKEQVESIPNKKSEQYYDSSVSISEDDYERRIQEQKKAFPPSPHKDLNKTPVTGNFRHSMKKSTSGNNIDNERDNDGFKVPLIITRINQKPAEKQKPIIKSCEPTNFVIKQIIRHPQKVQVSETSDVSIIEDDVSLNNKKVIHNTTTAPENHNPTDISHKDNVGDLGKELMQHPFLTYDSEDFLNEEEMNVQDQLSSIKSDKNRAKSPQFAEKSKINNTKTPANISGTKGETEEKSSSGKKKTPLSIKSTKNNLFGSKENPKVLASWIPCVVYDDEFKKKCSLTFEGKLLNEAGHVLKRKFVTSPVCQRHSSTLVETVHGEYYKLSGELNDTKHVLHKELLKQCRTGCPSKIKEFCEEWKRLRPVAETNASAKSSILDASIDTFSMSTSLRGRRIVPTLEWWKGERIVTKDNDTIYTPGREWDSSSLNNLKKSETSKKPMSLSEQRPPKNSTKKEVAIKTTKSSTKPKKTKNTSSQKSKEKPAPKRVAQTLEFSSSSDCDQQESPIKRTLRRPKQKVKSNPLLVSQPKSTSPQFEVDILTESAYNTKLRKRQRLEANGNQQLKKPTKKFFLFKRSQASTKKPDSELVWTYEKEQRHRDILSDDQTSIRYCDEFRKTSNLH